MVATRRPSDSSGMVRKRKQTTPRRVVFKTSASQVSAKAPSANNQRQRVALQVYRNRHSEIVRQTVCNVWTAYQLDCISLGEPGTRDSQDEGDKNCPYCQCQKQEEIQPMSGENVSCFHPDERAPSTYNYCTLL